MATLTNRAASQKKQLISVSTISRVSTLITMPRFKTKVVLPVLVIIVVLTYWHLLTIRDHYRAFTQPLLLNQPQDKPVVGQGKVKDLHQFWNQVFSLFTEAKPQYQGEVDQVIQFNKEDPLPGFSKPALELKFRISDDNVKGFKQLHDLLMKKLPKKLSTEVYKPGTKGIALIGGGRFLWLSFLALTNLRDLGLKLPVELIIPTFLDYEKERDFCQNVLPELNARCVLVPDVLGPDIMNNWEFKNYQYKPLALIVSSFEEVLLLDSDNYVLENPDYLLELDVAKTYGMITWPDYWRRLITPHFYDITGVKVNEKKRVRYNRLPLAHDKLALANLDQDGIANIPFHEMEGLIPDLLTELGQLYLNKALHPRTLLLLLYYNMYGPKLYYRMFSSGQDGEGDKDTFIAAAHVVNEPYYQLKTAIRTMGYTKPDGGFQGVAMGQADPIEDHAKFQLVVKDPVKPTGDETINLVELKQGEDMLKGKFGEHVEKKMFAMHCNWPKFDPIDLMQKPEIYDAEANKLRHRFYGDLTYKKNQVINGQWTPVEVNFEVERWKEVRSVLCERRISFVHFSKVDIERICEFAKNQVDWLEAEVKKAANKNKKD